MHTGCPTPKLAIQKHAAPDSPDSHPDLRRLTPGYQKKKQWVRNLWVISLMIMLLLPLAAKLALGLTTTFIGLTILDETQ